MMHRSSYPSAGALLILLLLLALSPPAWAQGGDEPVSSDEPSTQAQGEGTGEEEGGAEAAGSERDRDCSDFDTREEAQEFLESRGGPDEDPHQLDEDPGEDDGQACENLPSEGSDDDTPSGGVDSGYGPVVPESAAGAPPTIALVGTGLGVLALVGLGVARTRRAG